jgi:hypothetical protein
MQAGRRQAGRQAGRRTGGRAGGRAGRQAGRQAWIARGNQQAHALMASRTVSFCIHVCLSHLLFLTATTGLHEASDKTKNAESEGETHKHKHTIGVGACRLLVPR